MARTCVVGFRDGSGAWMIAQAAPLADSLPKGAVREHVAALQAVTVKMNAARRQAKALFDQLDAAWRHDQLAGGKALAEGFEPPESMHDALYAQCDEAARQALALQTQQSVAAQALLDLEAGDWEKVAASAARTTEKLVGTAEESLRQARARIADVQASVKVALWSTAPSTAPRDMLTQSALDRLDAAQEAVSRVRDGSPAPDADVVSVPMSPNRASSAWVDAMRPVGS